MSWSEITRAWGTTAEEQQRSFPCDRLLPDHNEAYYRGVTILAEPATAFAWLCQLRAAPYSYDWIDNFGRRSPRVLNRALQKLELGQHFMSMFDLVSFEEPIHVTLRPRKAGPFPPMVVSYVIVPVDLRECRLIVKIALELHPGLTGKLVRNLGPWLDWIMMRRQLLNLKALAEGAR